VKDKFNQAVIEEECVIVVQLASFVTTFERTIEEGSKKKTKKKKLRSGFMKE
jgi:hypothetical protein